jgi:hypothetical protein
MQTAFHGNVEACQFGQNFGKEPDEPVATIGTLIGVAPGAASGLPKDSDKAAQTEEAH